MSYADAFATAERPVRYATKREMHDAVAKRPVRDDKLPSLVYADWLEENGSPNTAAFIRMAAEHPNGEVGVSGSGRGVSSPVPQDGDHVTAFPWWSQSHTRLSLSVGVPMDTPQRWAATTVYRVTLPHRDAHEWLKRLSDDGVHFASDEADALAAYRPEVLDRPTQMQRDSEPLPDALLAAATRKRRRLNSEHQRARADRNRKLTPEQLVEKIRSLVAKKPRSTSQLQASLRLDSAATKAAIEHGERSGAIRTEKTAKGSVVQPPAADPSPHPSQQSERLSRHYAAYRAPEGGVAVKGVYYPGGQLVPDLAKFQAGDTETPKPNVVMQRLAAAVRRLREQRAAKRGPKPVRDAEVVEMQPTGSYRGSQQFGPVRDAEEQVISPAGPPVRGSQQLQVLPPRPAGLRELSPKSRRKSPATVRDASLPAGVGVSDYTPGMEPPPVFIPKGSEVPSRPRPRTVRLGGREYEVRKGNLRDANLSQDVWSFDDGVPVSDADLKTLDDLHAESTPRPRVRVVPPAAIEPPQRKSRAADFADAFARVRYARPPAEELAAWQRSIAEQPHDRVRRGAFADWLEEHGYHHDDATLRTLREHDGPVGLHEHPGSGEVISHPRLSHEELIAAYREQMRDAYGVAAGGDGSHLARSRADDSARTFADNISSIHHGPNGVFVGVWRGDGGDVSRGGSVLKFDPQTRRFTYQIRNHFDPNEGARRAAGSPRD